ncbi:hypothetical protein P7B02_02995 [Caulobacter segnis]|uniref:hypothetical protein n=1 Tax=Caulobacter segnis TaxID=88688 RepID=UPI00241065CB|nr:hypothetical protein [Caulobacter segnis]MDG2520496.1 hypothetical protein [Caulobacter segnis]
MNRVDANTNFGVIWLAPILLIYFTGGLLQYAGLLSQTQSNWLALGLFGHVFLSRAAWYHVQVEAILAVLIVVIALSYLQHGTPLSNTITYLYYVLCTIVAAVAGRVYAMRLSASVSTGAFFKIIKIFLLIELSVVILQKSFTSQFIQYSQAPIGYIDAIFGTFFLQSDASLAAVCELIIVSTFFLYCRMVDRLIICALAVLIIFLGNSNAAKATSVLLFIPLFAYGFYRNLNASRYGFNIMLAFVVTAFVLVMYNPLSNFFADFFVRASSEFYRRESWESAARFSPLGQILSEGVSLFGQGALTYYNPITKAWLYNAGFSTIYSLYIDFGLAGLFVYVFYQLILVVKYTKNYLEFLVFVGVLASFMALNFALTDIAFIFSFNGALYLNYICGRSGPQRA